MNDTEPKLVYDIYRMLISKYNCNFMFVNIHFTELMLKNKQALIKCLEKLLHTQMGYIVSYNMNQGTQYITSIPSNIHIVTDMAYDRYNDNFGTLGIECVYSTLTCGHRWFGVYTENTFGELRAKLNEIMVHRYYYDLGMAIIDENIRLSFGYDISNNPELLEAINNMFNVVSFSKFPRQYGYKYTGSNIYIEYSQGKWFLKSWQIKHNKFKISDRKCVQYRLHICDM